MLKLVQIVTTAMLMMNAGAIAQPTPPTTAPTTQQSDAVAEGAARSASRQPIRVKRPSPSGVNRGEDTAASRGGKGLPTPIVFAEPEDAGLTISPNPTICFYMPEATAHRAVVTLNDPNEAITLGRVKFDAGFAKPGVYRVQMTELREPLKPGQLYTWTVSIKSPSGNNAENALVVAVIRYEPNPELLAQVAKLPAEDRARVLGENAIWYDAIAALTEAIEKNPTDTFLRAERTRLLIERQKENAATFEQMPESR